jgi:hypothetical protein
MAQRQQVMPEKLRHERDERWRRREVWRIQQKMLLLKNQMDFMEILANFWPMDNMESRARRLAQEMDELHHKRKSLTR